MADLLKFKKGLASGLSSATITPGTVYITTDERAMYVDIDANNRIRLGDFIIVKNLTTLSTSETYKPYSSTSLYYLEDENALARYDAVKNTWTQINDTKALSDRITALETAVTGTNGLTSQVSGLTTRMQTAEGKITTAEGKIENLETTRLTEVKVNGTAVTKTGTSVNITLGALASKDKVAAGDLANDLTTKLSGYDTSIANAATKNELKTVSDKADTNATNISTINKKLGSDFTESNTVSKAVSDIKTTLTGFSSTATVKTTTDELNRLIGVNAGEISTLKTADEGIRNRLNALEAYDEANTTNINTINNTLDSHDERITAAQSKADKGVTDAAAAQGTANSALSKANSNATEIEGLKGSVSSIQTNYATKNELTQAKNNLQGQIDDHTTTIGGHTSTLANHETRITNAETTISGHTTSISNLNTEVGKKVNASDYNTKITAIEKSISDNATTAANAAKEAKELAQAAQNKANTNAESIDGHNTRISNVETKLNNVSNVMDFIGVSTTDPATGKVTINSTEIKNPNKGDVTIYGEKEYVYDGSSWKQFGDASGNANAIADLTTRVSTAEGKITTLEGKMTTAEGKLNSHDTALANRYTKTETDQKISDALTWGTF